MFGSCSSWLVDCWTFDLWLSPNGQRFLIYRGQEVLVCFLLWRPNASSGNTRAVLAAMCSLWIRYDCVNRFYLALSKQQHNLRLNQKMKKCWPTSGKHDACFSTDTMLTHGCLFYYLSLPMLISVHQQPPVNGQCRYSKRPWHDLSKYLPQRAHVVHGFPRAALAYAHVH